ncbi:glycosyltransferase family 4 protein [Marinomonas foliarum]|uniref:Glycosyltransferase involved in cell wall biosynthesis n=1 Tax=Marinomonas foliarum TaxID=491950 RepID=A0A368ZX08_9GAMM|nr:glycosyltransferase family 4 protein [Marinomonas foliarum]RCX00377.1 glycosyltransferase involved in cell wall biosynthesis [Marinomonas foliarum]
MRIAIVHDWFVSPGGAENVIEAMLDIFPDADVFSVVDFFDDVLRKKYLHGKKTKNTFIQKMPFAQKKYRMYLPLMPFAIEQLDLTEYDLVISSSHAVAKGVIASPNQLHICYCYSPIRYAWDLKFDYLKESNLTKGFKSLLARYFLHKIRIWDLASSNNVDYFISISRFIKERIYKCYRRDSTIIFPNVDVDAFPLHEVKDDFYFTASRLVPYKRLALIAEAFSKMPDKKLIIIGDGPERDKVEKIASSSSNISYLGYQDYQTLKEHMMKARAFIFAAEEDFGIVPLEAQACGTPVIAFAKGGSLDTVIDKKTGFYFYKQTADSIIKAVKDFEENHSLLLEPSKIRAHAMNFSTDIFKSNFKRFVLEKCKAKGFSI